MPRSFGRPCPSRYLVCGCGGGWVGAFRGGTERLCVFVCVCVCVCACARVYACVCGEWGGLVRVDSCTLERLPIDNLDMNETGIEGWISARVDLMPSIRWAAPNGEYILACYMGVIMGAWTSCRACGGRRGCSTTPPEMRRVCVCVRVRTLTREGGGAWGGRERVNTA